MEIAIGSKVIHIPSGDIITVEKINLKSYVGTSARHRGRIRFQKTDCVLYVEPVKEKSFYEKMRERNLEDAKKLSPIPSEIGQHILWLKMAVIDRVEKIENIKDSNLCTFRCNEKFGFTESYVNILMHYAFEAGMKNATDNLTSQHESSTKSMKSAIDSIIKALENNDLIGD